MVKQFTNASLQKLAGVHPNLQKVAQLALQLSETPFIITEGLRTIERQKDLVAHGASQTMRSRHIHGFAIDFAAIIGGEVRWDWPLYDKISKSFKEAAKQLKINIEWGGDWKTLKDGPHIQLLEKEYPDPKEIKNA